MSLKESSKQDVKEALGFKKDQILVITNEGRQDIQPLKTALLQKPRISGVTGSLQLPSSIGMYNNVIWESAAEGEEIELIHNTVDYDFLDTFEIELLAGRNFPQTAGVPAAAFKMQDPSFSMKKR